MSDITDKSKKKSKSVPGTIERDSLATLIVDSLNKLSSKTTGDCAHFLDQKEDASTINDWVSTGSTLLDLAVSNRKYGGLPFGKMVEFSGLEGCVTEDTIIEVRINTNYTFKITVGEVKILLSEGKNVEVRTLNNEFTKISNFVEKGILDTFRVTLSNGFEIKVSREHKFFTNTGWLETKDIIPNETSILCEDTEYYIVTSVENIGKHRIVDITVDHPEHCYFGNGMLNHNTGKSLLAAHIIANTQKLGGVGILIDTESSAAPEFWKSFGVKLDNLAYVEANTVEDIFTKIEDCIEIVKKANKKKLLTIVVDSVAGASTVEEMEAEHGKTGYATGKSIIISKALRKITHLIAKEKVLIVFTNQLRVNLNAGPFSGDKYCVDPVTTKIKIQYTKKDEFKFTEEELTISEFADRFYGIESFNLNDHCLDGDHNSPIEFFADNLNIEVLGKNLETGKDEYNRINSFIIKPYVSSYYTDGFLRGTDMHRIIENGKEIHLKDHPDFKLVNEPMEVVDFNIANSHNYYANGRLNHNTISGGKGIPYHSSIRVRLNNLGKLKKDDDVIGTKCKAQVTKTRMGPNHKVVDFDIYYDSGIADYSSWIEVLKKYEIIGGDRGRFSYTDNSGKVIEFTTGQFVGLMNSNPTLKDELYNKIADKYIMLYKDPNSVIVDDVEVTEETESGQTEQESSE